MTLSLTRHTTSLNWNAIAQPKGNDWRQLCLDNRTNSDMFFDVDIVDLNEILGGSFKDTDGRQAVYDATENRIIAVHGAQYSLIKNEYAYNMVNRAINELGAKGVIDVTDMHIKDACVNKGGKAIRQYIFPNHKLNFDGDEIMMRIVVINSYDGSANFSLQVGGFRVVCLNGLISGKSFMNLNKRHSGVINLANLERQIITATKSFNQLGELWRQMLSTPISQAKSDAIWADFATEKGSERPSLQKYGMMCDLFENHAKTLGRNYWAAYNTLTAWSTHYEVQDRNIENKADVILKRESKVSSIINNKKLWIPA
ncbi:DUF945 domain-containing protein [Vibrio vulnificus]|uniref:DUF945 domain-containing protein n=1 Tax=Vibrio vulnificus TaxID=672 RepID=UPI0021DA00D2|nr:DUF945 domain-containing protein [Vibrio vulnificus]EHD1699105.1 DUF945 domain-containing protein [Vibrio vulnificus]EKZ9225727.1 DUF932 domain-containing protein [Vibrio vulnificus]ELC9583717.1 DUF932 domain-containing protein [Vibrio vulnificus]MCU8150271.1 DUF945 domain-containing protein [Vibrio vulnificus]